MFSEPFSSENVNFPSKWRRRSSNVCEVSTNRATLFPFFSDDSSSIFDLWTVRVEHLNRGGCVHSETSGKGRKLPETSETQGPTVNGSRWRRFSNFTCFAESAEAVGCSLFILPSHESRNCWLIDCAQSYRVQLVTEQERISSEKKKMRSTGSTAFGIPLVFWKNGGNFQKTESCYV